MMSLKELYAIFSSSTGVSTDTRKDLQNKLFFALKGDNFDGNVYAKNAIEKGALYAIIDDHKYKESEKYILVEDTLKTLQELASYHRTELGLKIIALTGSNGKTTTKELINAVLSTSFSTQATVGNLNNHIGVPLTLLAMDKNTEIGIVEMGANHLKEIEALCEIAKPDYGYITNIGKAHLEGFGGIEGVLQGKTEMYRFLENNEKMVFLNTDDSKLAKAAKGIKSYTFSQNNSSDVSITFISASPMVVASFQGSEIQSNLIGAYNFTNIAAAITIGNYFAIPFAKIQTAIASYTPTNNRSQIIEKEHCTIILDAYNANPSSMEAAILNFASLEHDSKTVFLGDMLELGTSATEEHKKILQLSMLHNFDQIILVGQHFASIKVNAPNIFKFESFEELEKNKKLIKNVQSFLIKGSRGIQLERVLELL